MQIQKQMNKQKSLDNWKKKTDGDSNATDAGKDQSMFI